MRGKGIILLVGIMLLASGCSTTNHSVQATLYGPSSPEADTYDFVPFSSNPIFVDEKSVFEIRIDEIMPGWIHQGVVQNGPLEQHNVNVDCGNKGSQSCYYTSWTDGVADQLYGKELWIVSKVESVNKNDVLERNSKNYFNATNVKLNSFSFKPIPLDIDELSLFSHSSDSAYRLTVKVYEVQGFDIKREALRAYDQNPGISGLLLSAWEVVKNTIGAFAGESVENHWKKKSDEDQFIERLLLENGAVIEFQGVVHILREADLLDSVEGPFGLEQQFVLYDPYKSYGFDSSFASKRDYKAALSILENAVDLSAPNMEKSYLKFTVQQSLNLTELPVVEPAGGEASYAKAVRFLEEIELD